MSEQEAVVTISGLGKARIGFDRIRFGSQSQPSEIVAVAPQKEMGQWFHRYAVKKHGPNSYYWTEVNATISPKKNGLTELSRRVGDLILVPKEVEVAVDFHCATLREAEILLWKLIGQLDKPYHRRSHLEMVYKPEQYTDPKTGLCSVPTFYFEERGSSSRLKLYARREKLPNEKFDGYLVRIEWTLVGDAIKRRLQLTERNLKSLLRADLAEFIQKNLKLAEIDVEELGKLLEQKYCWSTPPSCGNGSSSRRMALLFLQYKAMQAVKGKEGSSGETDPFPNGYSLKHDALEEMNRISPVQVREWLKKLQEREIEEAERDAAKSPGTKLKARSKIAFTDHAINKVICRKPVQIRRNLDE